MDAGENPRVEVHILALHPELEGALRESRHTMEHAWQGDVQLHLLERESAPQAINELREHIGDGPLGVAARNETEALAAIMAGADAARVVDVQDPRSVGLLIEHTLVRARIRRTDMENQHTVAQADKLSALGTLVAGVAHEINNPLSAITLSVSVSRVLLEPVLDLTAAVKHASDSGAGLRASEVAKLAEPFKRSDGEDSHEVTDVLGEIAQASDAIASVVRDLRVYARRDHEEKPTMVRLPELIDQSVRLVNREFANRGLVERDYPKDLPQVALPRNRVTQVITNLLINAAHAIRSVEREHHSVRISARADDDMVAIAVSDTGPGIKPEDVERIFDPFYTTKREGMGTGLGLSISRSIVQRLGGELLVDSVYGDGATFVCMLPRPSAAEAQSAYFHGRVIAPANDDTQLSLLVVDDDERILRAYGRLLGREYRVIAARDGREAQELIVSGSIPDVVLMEVELPEVDGPTLYAWLQQNEPSAAARTLFVTGAQDRPELGAFLEDHADRTLFKPVAPEQLRDALVDVATRTLPTEPDYAKHLH